MLDDGQSQTGSLVFGGVIRFENAFEFIRRNSRPVVTDRNINGMVPAMGGGDKNVSFLAERLARVLQKIDENFRQMIALHQQWWKRIRIFPMDPDFCRHHR